EQGHARERSVALFREADFNQVQFLPPSAAMLVLGGSIGAVEEEVPIGFTGDGVASGWLAIAGVTLAGIPALTIFTVESIQFSFLKTAVRSTVFASLESAVSM